MLFEYVHDQMLFNTCFFMFIYKSFANIIYKFCKKQIFNENISIAYEKNHFISKWLVL